MASGASSLFVNGDASVRITRISYTEGAAILSVLGPGGGTAVYTCLSERDCSEKQGQIEASLLATGYSASESPERRSIPDRRRFPRGDRRRQRGASSS
jgi:hypothetical protein